MTFFLRDSVKLLKYYLLALKDNFIFFLPIWNFREYNRSSEITILIPVRVLPSWIYNLSCQTFGTFMIQNTVSQ